MNHESEKDMTRDVEDHPKLYQALADDENRYKSMEVDKSGEIDEKFWWSEWGHLNSLKEELGATLVLMWIGLILASLSTLYFDQRVSLAIVWLFLVSSTVTWWVNVSKQQEWVDENNGEWE